MIEPELLEKLIKETLIQLLAPKKKVLVLTEYCETLKIKIDQVFNKEYEVCFNNFETNWEDYKVVILNELSLQQISRLAFGVAVDEFEKRIFNHLLAGRKLFLINFEIDTLNPQMEKVILENFNRLKLFGVKLLKDKNLEETKDLSSKKLITEIDILELSKNSQVIFSGAVIITPAAKDMIRQRKIKVRYI